MWLKDIICTLYLTGIDDEWCSYCFQARGSADVMTQSPYDDFEYNIASTFGRGWRVKSKEELF